MEFNSRDVLDYINNTIAPALKYTSPNFVKLFKKQEEFIRKFCIKNYIIACHSRQVGVSLALELLTITLCRNFPNINIAYIDATDINRKNFFIRLTNILNHLENDKIIYQSNCLDKIEFDNGSNVYICSPETSRIDHYKRIIFSVVIVNNASYIDNLAQVLSSLDIIEKLDDKHGSPNGIILASTPKNREGFFYNCWIDEKNRFYKFKWSWRETKKDKEWYRNICLSLNNDKNMIKRELDLEFADS
jgi:hypothetical protein